MPETTDECVRCRRRRPVVPGQPGRVVKIEVLDGGSAVKHAETRCRWCGIPITVRIIYDPSTPTRMTVSERRTGV